MESTTLRNAPGRKPFITEHLKRKILREIWHGVHDNTVKINKSLRVNENIIVSNEAIRKHLRQAGYKGRVKIKKQL